MVIYMEFAIAKVSTKGQVVIPSPLREGISKGDEILIVKEKGRIILKNMKEIAHDLKDDLIFAERVEKAWKEYDKGKFKTKSAEEFLRDLQAC